MTGTPLLELNELRKSYGAVVAVDGISLELRRGEFLTLLGPSGSGKTTTLVMVAGLTEPSGGTILLEGRRLDPLPPWRRDIGVVFQHYALFPHMTVAQNVAFPLEMRKLARGDIKGRVERSLSLVGLGAHGARYPRELSGGQQQRVALARAMVFEPRLLLMDEPLGALDKKLREQMQIEILRLHKELGISVLYVTHDQEEALVMSDRIAVFNAGRLEQVGAPAALYDTPATRFVAEFIGDTNLFGAKVTEVAEGFALLEGAGIRLRARNAGALAPGAAAAVAVRPERIRLVPVEASTAPSENQLLGRIRDLIYLGKSRKYMVRLDDGPEVAVLDQALHGDAPALAPGALVRLEWRAEAATALPEQ
jgi:putative spermidine/putrescine transport system ATP-binding protein